MDFFYIYVDNSGGVIYNGFKFYTAVEYPVACLFFQWLNFVIQTCVGTETVVYSWRIKQVIVQLLTIKLRCNNKYMYT